LLELATATKQTMSEVFRQLVMNARIEETRAVKPVSKLIANDKAGAESAKTLAGNVIV
jgi:hypothetical protein